MEYIINIENVTDTRYEDNIVDTHTYAYAGHDSRLWNLCEADPEFNKMLMYVDNALYTAGLTYDNMIRIFNEEQSNKWCERIFNADSRYKYISPLIENGQDWLFMLQGSRAEHRKWWLSSRFNIYNAKYITGPYLSQNIEVKCGGLKAGAQFSITAGRKGDYGYGINNTPREKNITLNENDTKTFTTTDREINVGDPIRIYNAYSIKGIDLSNIAGAMSNLSFEHITDKVLGNILEDVILGGPDITSGLQTISGLNNLTNLKNINIEGFKNINSLDLNTSKLESIKAKRSGVTSFSSNAKNLKIAEFDKLQSLELYGTNQVNIKTVLEDNKDTLTHIVIKDCDSINDLDIILPVLSYKNIVSVKLYNVNWNNVTLEQFSKIIEAKKTIAGNTGTLQELYISGKIILKDSDESLVSDISTLFGSNVFNKENELYIFISAGVYITGPKEILSGETAKYNVIVTGDIEGSTSDVVVSGNMDGIEFDKEKLLIKTTESDVDRNISMRVVILSSDNTIVKTLEIKVIKRIFPENSHIEGNTIVQDGINKYNIVIPNIDNVNGKYEYIWELTGDAVEDKRVEIESHTKSSINIKLLKISTDEKLATLTYYIIKDFNKKKIKCADFIINAIDPNIIMTQSTNPAVLKILYESDIAKNEKYLTRMDAVKTTEEQIKNLCTILNNKYRHNEEVYNSNFTEFKYFLGLKHIPNIYNGYQQLGLGIFNHLILPDSATSMDEIPGNTILEIPDSVKTINNNSNVIIEGPVNLIGGNNLNILIFKLNTDFYRERFGDYNYKCSVSSNRFHMLKNSTNLHYLDIKYDYIEIKKINTAGIIRQPNIGGIIGDTYFYNNDISYIIFNGKKNDNIYYKTGDNYSKTIKIEINENTDISSIKNKIFLRVIFKVPESDITNITYIPKDNNYSVNHINADTNNIIYLEYNGYYYTIISSNSDNYDVVCSKNDKFFTLYSDIGKICEYTIEISKKTNFYLVDSNKNKINIKNKEVSDIHTDDAIAMYIEQGDYKALVMSHYIDFIKYGLVGTKIKEITQLGEEKNKRLNGFENTKILTSDTYKNIIDTNGIKGAPIAEFCINKTLLDHKGYLPSKDELAILVYYKHNVDFSEIFSKFLHKKLLSYKDIPSSTFSDDTSDKVFSLYTYDSLKNSMISKVSRSDMFYSILVFYKIDGEL